MTLNPHSASPFPEIRDVPPTPEEHKREALGNLTIARLFGHISAEEFDTFAEMLGLDEPAHVIHLDRARAINRRSKGIGATA